MRLTLFFTHGLSLRIWDQTGMFAREVALYQRLQTHGVEVGFVTYGDASELKYADHIPGIHILFNRWRLPRPIYGRLVPWLHASWLEDSDIIKTNQINGADIALRAARVWHTPLIARCGYMLSLNTARTHGPRSLQAWYARRLEERVFSVAQRVVVTTPTMAADIATRIPRAAAHTLVIPNYVETNRFRPNGQVAKDTDVIFVGRLSPEKNLEALLEAVKSLGLTTTIVGAGDLREPLESCFGCMEGRLRWQGMVPNSELPAWLNDAKLFVLPSHYEAHPKTLLEAMACGLPVLGADSPGIRSIIRHDDTGWLCGTGARAIEQAIRELMRNPERRMQLGRRAREYVVENFALDRIVEKELALYREVVQADA